MTDRRHLLRDLPSIDRLLGDAAVGSLLALHPRPAVLDALRAASDVVRRELMEGDGAFEPQSFGRVIVEHARTSLDRRARAGMLGVVNATGVVLHTNLGRALLCREALDAIARAGAAYTNLEYDLDSGRRGHRAGGLASLLIELTGAEAACVVNNNAASMLLILDTLARGREVVVSRSEMIEIGGSFRLPDVLERSGAGLREVGTTNKTYVRDYERAITDATGLLLKSHPSNYRIVGFTAEVTAGELAALGRARGVTSLMDLGSGVMIDLARYGLPYEPTVRECVESGLDLVCFSGDKLLGGPQAGIIVGKREAVEQCARNPLMRALRCDKLTLAALEATLSIYRYPERLPDAIPVLRMLTERVDRLQARAAYLCDAITSALGADISVRVVEGVSLTGGGALPGEGLPTWLVVLAPAGLTSASLVERLRSAPVPVIARVESDQVLLDVRTMLEGDDLHVVAACRQAVR